MGTILSPTVSILETGLRHEAMKELEKEIGGRKFDLDIDLNDQRPCNLDSDVLSQRMTQFMLRIVNPVDQAKVAESMDRDLFQELPALSKGQAIVAGAAVNTPVLCRVRRRITEHNAEDADKRHPSDAPARWLTSTAPSNSTPTGIPRRRGASRASSDWSKRISSTNRRIEPITVRPPPPGVCSPPGP